MNNETLTFRQREVFKMLSAEKTQYEIAQVFGVSTRTIDDEIRRLKEMTGARSLVGLALYAERNALLK